MVSLQRWGIWDYTFVQPPFLRRIAISCYFASRIIFNLPSSFYAIAIWVFIPSTTDINGNVVDKTSVLAPIRWVTPCFLINFQVILPSQTAQQGFSVSTHIRDPREEIELRTTVIDVIVGWELGQDIVQGFRCPTMCGLVTIFVGKAYILFLF